MKKLLILLLIAPNFLLAMPLTLSEYIAKNPSWISSDRSSLSYITLRCGVLFEQITEFYKNNAEEQEIYKIAPTDAKNFSRASSDIYKTSCINYECIKVEKKDSQEKEKKWALIYKEELMNNINNDDEMIHGYIRSDFSTCKINVEPILK